MKNSRSLIVTAVVGVAIVLVILVVRGVFPPREGTEAAVGAANRYNAGQIDAKDVQLQDAEIQAFIQSDVFRKIATNAEFRQLVQEQRFRDLASMEAYQSIMEHKDRAQSLASQEFARYLVDPTTVALVTSEAYMRLASECNMSELLRIPSFYVLLSSALERRPTAIELQQMVLESKGLPPSFIEFARISPDVVRTALQPALLEGREIFLNLNGAAELMSNPNVGSVLENKEFGELLRTPSHMELMRSNPEIMVLAFNSEVFNKLAEMRQWSELEKGISAIEVR